MIESLFKKQLPSIDEIDDLQEFIVYDVHGEREGMHNVYAVNPWTGDVWDLWGCKREPNPTLHKIQEDIKQKFSTEELKEYQKFHLLRPVNVGLDPC